MRGCGDKNCGVEAGKQGVGSRHGTERARATILVRLLQFDVLDPLDATRRKLLYRSKQRGWLEMDIMLGNWAAANLPRLQEAELQRTLPYHGTG